MIFIEPEFPQRFVVCAQIKPHYNRTGTCYPEFELRPPISDGEKQIAP
jgi:hypothetical protein